MTAHPTLLGTLGDDARGWVDARGAVVARLGAPPLDWAVGAEDRWHRASEEVSVRQTLVQHAPVVETRMRIPGGDAVHRCYAIQGPTPEGAGAFVVVEVENDSPVPVAVAFRPDGVGSSASADGSTVVVDDAALLVFTGEPRVDEEHGFVVAVPHRTRARLALPMQTVAPGDVRFPGVVPDAATVASGWTTQVARGARLELASDVDRDDFERHRRQLLLVQAGDRVFRPGGPHAGDVVADAEVAMALAELGFADEAGRLTAGLLGRGPLKGVEGAALAAATGRCWQLTRDRALAEAAVESVAVAARAARRHGGPGDREALTAAAVLFDAVGETRAAAATRADAEAATGQPLPEGVAVPAPARDVRRARRTLVDDEGPTLDLVPGFTPGWRGQAVEAHGVPTRFGALSFALRWHGSRPALLWELDLIEGEDAPTPRVAAVDPDWRGSGPTGEALLAAVEPEGG